MTTTYDPTEASYTDEAPVRDELTRVFDVCQSCRRCVDLCTSFPTLFDMLDRHEQPDAGLLTPVEQDQVVDECFQCKLCAADCPYTPDLHEAAVDFPRLMLRARAMQFEHGHISARERATSKVLGRVDGVGRLATMTAPAANHVVGAKPGSWVRTLTAKVSGVSAQRLLAPFARQRFSDWFDQRPKINFQRKQATVTVFPTCLVEYQATSIGKDLVKVYERNGIECNQSGAQCCGAPLLHAGDIDRFTKVAEKNVKVLAAEVRRGTDVVVPQPTCSYVIKNDYPDYVGGEDADLVASHTFDAAEYLMTLHRSDGHVLDTDFHGDVPDTVTYHAPGHLRGQNIGYQGRDLLKLTGARVLLIQQSSGIESMWGYREGNDDTGIRMAERLGEQIDRVGGDVIAGGCHLSNTAIVEQTGRQVSHPLQVVARAYGIPDER
ncbi:heterodisulfide reductase-related iron-sulfur binding cluster [Ilumatobacter sp.]|uniref:heterodisulfide reductase-related iron-sulfur binding cluster n=1 Tax=Ilumatobacter sp. TaxID=1967498 RepID=UPI003C6677CB